MKKVKKWVVAKKESKKIKVNKWDGCKKKKANKLKWRSGWVDLSQLYIYIEREEKDLIA